MTLLSQITAAILLLIALFHLLWGINVYWPAKDEASLARAVVGAKGITQMPNFWACSFVTVALLIGAVIVLSLGGAVRLASIPIWIFQILGAGFALVLLARGIIGFTPFWAGITPEEPFLTLNRLYYSPLCLALGASVVTLLIRSRFYNSL
ncbi:DUF3995 domain-containing protein [Litorimonas sp. WD9-15]|uniref:DUF3995 domain-containing protein n=1 Tax=Litorimonas sp. WD9-15 TaxID=3418716 RepID=UPI003D01E7B7